MSDADIAKLQHKQRLVFHLALGLSLVGCAVSVVLVLVGLYTKQSISGPLLMTVFNAAVAHSVITVEQWTENNREAHQARMAHLDQKITNHKEGHRAGMAAVELDITIKRRMLERIEEADVTIHDERVPQGSKH